MLKVSFQSLINAPSALDFLKSPATWSITFRNPKSWVLRLFSWLFLVVMSHTIGNANLWVVRQIMWQLHPCWTVFDRLVIQHLQVLVQWFFYIQLFFAKSVRKQAGIKLQIYIIEMDRGILDRPDIETISVGADKKFQHECSLNSFFLWDCCYFLISALKSQQAEKLPPAFLLMEHDWSILSMGRTLLSSEAWGWWWL